MRPSLRQPLLAAMCVASDLTYALQTPSRSCLGFAACARTAARSRSAARAFATARAAGSCRAPAAASWAGSRGLQSGQGEPWRLALSPLCRPHLHPPGHPRFGIGIGYYTFNEPLRRLATEQGQRGAGPAADAPGGTAGPGPVAGSVGAPSGPQAGRRGAEGAKGPPHESWLQRRRQQEEREALAEQREATGGDGAHRAWGGSGGKE
jgi:hypothetical protein